MPSLRIRPRNVLGFKPSIRAAPRSPSIFHRVLSSTRRICVRSTSCNEALAGCGAAVTVAIGDAKS